MKRWILILIVIGAMLIPATSVSGYGRRGRVYYNRPYVGARVYVTPRVYVAPRTYYRPYYRSYYGPYYGGYGYRSYYYPQRGVYFYPGAGIGWYW
jgi:hypothetical protein